VQHSAKALSEWNRCFIVVLFSLSPRSIPAGRGRSSPWRVGTIPLRHPKKPRANRFKNVPGFASYRRGVGSPASSPAPAPGRAGRVRRRGSGHRQVAAPPRGSTEARDGWRASHVAGGSLRLLRPVEPALAGRRGRRGATQRSCPHDRVDRGPARDASPAPELSHGRAGGPIVSRARTNAAAIGVTFGRLAELIASIVLSPQRLANIISRTPGPVRGILGPGDNRRSLAGNSSRRTARFSADFSQPTSTPLDSVR